MRADVYLAEKGLCESRSRAKSYIEGGMLYVNGANIKKCSFDITENDEVELRGEVIPFVSRGGLKLLGAIEAFSLDVTGLTAVDIGASTGGFTDCLLKHGAKKVYAVDCGKDQLHRSLISDPRVKNIEGFNARELTDKTLGEKCDLAVMDVSFISQTLLHEAVSSVLKDGGTFISLIKPQFEAGRSALSKGGIVKNQKAHISVIRSVTRSANTFGLALTGLIPSPIEGGDGNREYLASFVLGGIQTVELNDEFLKRMTISQGKVR